MTSGPGGSTDGGSRPDPSAAAPVPPEGLDGPAPDAPEGPGGPGAPTVGSMRPRRPPSVASGLWGMVFLLLGGLLAVGAAAAVAFVIAMGQLDDAATRWTPADRLNDDLRQSATSAQTAVRGYIVTGNPQQLRLYHGSDRRFHDRVDEALAVVGDDPTVSNSIERQRTAFDAWVTDVAEPALVDRASDPSGAYARVTDERALDLAGRFIDANSETQNRITIRQAALRDRLDDFLRRMLFVVAAVAALSVLLTLYRSYRMRRSLVDPLRSIRDTVARLGSGDLEARATPTGFAEVTAVAESVNTLAEENQRLSARQTRRIERERQGRRLAASLHEHLELGRILSMAGAAIGESLHADRVVFRLAADEGFGPPVLEWRAPGIEPLDPMADRPLPRQNPLVAPLFDGRVNAVTEVAADAAHRADGRAGPGLREVLDELGVRSVLAVPVLAGEVIVALIVVHETAEARTWSPSEIELVQAMADELGSAIRHAQLYEAERSMVEQLRQLDEVKSDFVSSVSHELRTPLTSVMGYLEMLRDREAGPLTPEQDRMLDIVERNTERLLALIEDLLALARIESGRFKVVPVPLELPPLVDAAIDAFRPELAKRELRLLIDVPPGLPLVLGDGRQLERVLLNLLSNAVKFTPPGGQIRVTLAPRVRSVVLEVADTGLGIPVEEQDKLFTRFFRSSSSQVNSVPGTGLGLMIVKAVVDSHGGSIDVRSAAGFGTAVIVTLPAVPVSARVEAAHT